jgi:hypothetical protein
MEQERGLRHRLEKAAVFVPRSDAMMIATRARVSNTRRMIAESRELVDRARQTLDYSRSLRGLVGRGPEGTR